MIIAAIFNWEHVSAIALESGEERFCTKIFLKGGGVLEETWPTKEKAEQIYQKLRGHFKSEMPVQASYTYE